MRTAKGFENGRSQAVRLPKEYRFDVSEVAAGKIDDMVILMPKTNQWETFMHAIDLFSEDFMQDGRANQFVQDRETL